ncbi:RNA exonuclease 1 homolog [Topomyia yanbarensis]|uniref:RNA exonuclease 1 homolog n=1 Tax=Topomyia yanbarensis TaxID=2498891 RepID=UPI00273CD76E|nr:RNA exonuclease 1 homolog [Topomyia yanbarensis]
MLPATGLFRTVNCPFFEKDLCTRPYCHFKHIKLEIPAAATYSATPKSILNRNSASSVAVSDGPIKKKPKLEYIPMPTIITPKYVPSVKSTIGSLEKKVVESSIVEKEEQSDEINNENENRKPQEEEHAIEAEEKEIPCNGHDDNDDEKRNDAENVSIETKTESASPKISAAISEPQTLDKKQEDSSRRRSSSSRSSHKKSSRDDKDHRRDKNNHKGSDRKKSSSDGKHSASSHKEDKHRTKSVKDRDHDKERSRSKHKEDSRNKEKNSAREKDCSKSSDKNRHRSSHRSSRDSTRSSTNSSKKTSSSSSSTKSEKNRHKSSTLQSSSSKPKVELAEEIYRELLDNPPSDIDVESDEDEVMKQCKMIFEEYDASASSVQSTHEQQKKNSEVNPSRNQTELIDMFADKYYDESRKKRVAHENVTASKPTSKAPPPVRKTNHVQNAMRSVYQRQEIVRKQQEELAAKRRLEQDAKKRIEEETRKVMSKPVTPRLSNGSPRSPVLSPTTANTPPSKEQSPVSPISSSSFYKSPDTITTTPRTRFTPAVNVLAFQKAKEKIEHLKKMKAINTPAQTAPKGTGRTAHTGPALPEASTSASVVPAASAANATPSKPAPPVLEPDSTKISYNIRMQFYNLMIKHCLCIYPTCEDAWDRAQTEELAVVKKCSTPVIYKSSALLTINKLRKEASEAGSGSADKNKTISHDVILAGKMGQNISWSVNKKLKTEVKSSYNIDTAPSTVAYKMIYECILTEEQLQMNGFPRATETPGKAKMYTPKPSRPPNENERYCSRCSKVYNLDIYDEPAVDSCNYHNKSTCYRRGFADNMHSCCQQPAGSAGCMYANYHVTSYLDYDNLTGFVKTIDPPEGYVPSKKDVFALDCEMCYTTVGLELTRITVVDINEKTVYDTLVKPSNRVIDYNTRFSGITEQMLHNTTTTLYNVQVVLLSMFNSESILVGHSLESDFKALKLIHDVVVDTSVLYPHKMGPPKKRALKTLCIENLKKIIQENDAGHDSAEDSVVCIQLIKHYLRNRIL